MQTLPYAIQCQDTTTQYTGDFIYCEETRLNTGELKAISPIFTGLVELFSWCKANNIKPIFKN